MMQNFNQHDYGFMVQALNLAKKGLYTTHPNPRVGCVIVKNNKRISQGWHERSGQDHAEIMAIKNATQSLKNSSAYVTLEPCCHHGRTPPCVEALIDEGIEKVYVGSLDPDPRVAGRGVQMLRESGITVQTGLLDTQNIELNKGFFSRHRRLRPWLTLKTAVSLDGNIAMANGESQWITGKPARLDSHHFRAQSSAILTGINTLIADDPRLTVRLDDVDVNPIRIILDTSLRIPVKANVLSSHGQVIVFTHESSDSSKAIKLKNIGVKVIQSEMENDRLNLTKILTKLGQLQINEIYAECGSILGGALIKANLVDELIVYMAPKILGNNTQPMFSIAQLVNLQDHIRLTWHDQRQIGEDLRLIFRFENTHNLENK